MIDGLQVTHDTGCGCATATKCCKPAGDPLKRAIEMLSKDKDNLEAEWQPKDKPDPVEKKPITICEAETEAKELEDIDHELAAIDAELANEGDLEDEAFEAAW